MGCSGARGSTSGEMVVRAVSNKSLELTVKHKVRCQTRQRAATQLKR